MNTLKELEELMSFKRYDLAHNLILKMIKDQTRGELLTVDGYWLDDKGTFTGMVVATGEWDGIEDEKIFYYCDHQPVLGEHDDFVITKIWE